MFFKSKSRSIPDPKPLTEDENRSKELAWCFWDCKQYKEKMDAMFWPSSYAVKLYEDLIIGLAAQRRNFAINLKNHSRFFDRHRSRILPEPLTEDEEKADRDIKSSYNLFESWVDLPWYAATKPPEDFLNSFSNVDPDTYVSTNIEFYGDRLAIERGRLPPEQARYEEVKPNVVYSKDDRLEDFTIIIPPLPGAIYRLIYKTKSASTDRDKLLTQPFVKEGEILSRLSSKNDNYNCQKILNLELSAENTTNILAPVSGQIIYETGITYFECGWNEKTGQPEKLFHHIREFAKIRPVKGSNLQNTTYKAYQLIIEFCEQFVREPELLKQYSSRSPPGDAKGIERAISLLKEHQTVTTKTENQEWLKRKAKAAGGQAEEERSAKEKPASPGYSDYMAKKRMMNKPVPTKQTEKPKAAPSEPEEFEETAGKQQDKKTKDSSAKIEAARERMRVPDNITQDLLTAQYHKLVDMTPKDMLDQLNQDYELLMEAASTQEPVEDAVFVQSLTLMDLTENYTEASLNERYEWLIGMISPDKKNDLKHSYDYLLKHLRDRQRSADEDND